MPRAPKFYQFLVSTSLLCACSSCAGPTSPLGAYWSLKPAFSTFLDSKAPASLTSSNSNTGQTIRFDPPRQVLHAAKPLALIIEDPQGLTPEHHVQIKYNGLDVTQSFFRQAKITRSADQKQMRIQISGVHLLPQNGHTIEVSLYISGYNSGYLSEANNGNGLLASAVYPGPHCNLAEKKSILNTDDFEPEPVLIQTIESLSTQLGFNPSFAAGLIAQESSFNPRTVSWAKAVGLTQITPIAENELTDTVSSWPHYPGINDYPVPILKALVLAGEVNPVNEWRLDPKQSIRGGLAMLRMLEERWSSQELSEKLSRATTPSDLNLTVRPNLYGEEKTKLVLASYHSGLTRVVSAINRLGKDWLSAEDLRGARRYTNRVSSMCDQFSQLTYGL